MEKILMTKTIDFSNYLKLSNAYKEPEEGKLKIF